MPAYDVPFSLNVTANSALDTRVTGPSTALPDASVCYPGLLRYQTDTNSFAYFHADQTWKPWPEQVVTTVPQHIGKVYTATTLWNTMTVNDSSYTGHVPANVDTTVFTLSTVPAGTYIVKLQLSTAAPSPLSCLVFAKVVRTTPSAVSATSAPVSTVIGQTYQEGITPQTETTLVYTADYESDYSVDVYVALPTGVTHKQFSTDEASSYFKMTRILGENDLHEAVQQATIPPKTLNDAGNVLTVHTDASAVWQSPFPAKTAANAGDVLTVAADASAVWAPTPDLPRLTIANRSRAGRFPIVNQAGLLRHLYSGVNLNETIFGVQSSFGVHELTNLTPTGLSYPVTTATCSGGADKTTVWDGWFRARDDDGNVVFDAIQFQTSTIGKANVYFNDVLIASSFNSSTPLFTDTSAVVSLDGAEYFRIVVVHMNIYPSTSKTFELEYRLRYTAAYRSSPGADEWYGGFGTNNLSGSPWGGLDNWGVFGDSLWLTAPSGTPVSYAGPFFCLTTNWMKVGNDVAAGVTEASAAGYT